METIDYSVRDALVNNGFEVLELIGHGGFAQVVTVRWDKYPDQTFVAKAQLISVENNGVTIESYHAEIRALKNLFHPNIVKIFHHFEVNNIFIIIMEYYPNGTLQNLVERTGKLKEREFHRITKQILESIAFCHSKCIAHRDIKPSNLMIDSNFNVKLCDFGICEILTDNVNRFDGSTIFCAPEIIKRVQHDPIKADIWSLGVTFYYLFCGKSPWNMKNLATLKTDIVSGVVVFPPHTPSRIRNIISMMINLDPNARHSAKSILENAYYIESYGKINSIRFQATLQIVPTINSPKFTVRRKERLSFTKINNALTCSMLPNLDHKKRLIQSEKNSDEC